MSGPEASTLVLLTDATSTVIGQLVTSAATGAVVGQLGGVLVMDRIDATERIDLGAEVVTAGIELAGGVRSPYPKGLLIGQVVDVSRDANDVVQTAFLQPAANLDKLEYVLIITDYEGGLPPIEEQPVPVPERRHAARRGAALRPAHTAADAVGECRALGSVATRRHGTGSRHAPATAGRLRG